MKVWVPADSSARALDADLIAEQFVQLSAARDLAITLVRNGSRGMTWLEPLVEIDRGDGRVAYGNVTPEDVRNLLDGNAATLGPVDDIPYFADQTRLTFHRCGLIDPLSLEEYAANKGLTGLTHALSMGAAEIVEEVVKSALRGRGGAGLSLIHI